MSKLFVINKTLANLVFKNGYMTIPRGGFGRIGAEERDHSEFVYAEDRGWIDISEQEPGEVSVPAVETVAITNPNAGMTADELQAELAKEPEVAEPTATVESIGRDTTVEVNPAAEPAAEQADEATKPAKRSKKTA